MTRITITLDEHGQFTRICSDEAIEIYIVAPHVPHDRVYLYGSVEVGPQYVREEIGGYAVGHADDWTLAGPDDAASPRLPPSKPSLRAV
jgi:hypothetical protein